MINIRFALFGIAATLAATPAFAIDVSRTIEASATPAEVWTTIGDFCGIGTWHPAVTKCEPSEEGGTATRILTLGDGAMLKEQLVSRDDAAMTYTYTIVDGPLPVANYRSTIKVTPNGENATVTWTGTFDAKGATDDEAAGAIGGIYDAGLAAISDKVAM